MNEDFLKQLRKPPRREFTADLYQRINKPMSTKQSVFNTPLFRRTAFAFTALALVILLSLLLSPSVRAFAGEQIRQFGAIFISDQENGRDAAEGDTISEAAPQPTVVAPSEITADFVNTASEAAGLAGFAVLTPGYLPEGYSENSPWSVDNQDGSIYVVVSYGAADGYNFLLMNQTKFADDAHFNQQLGDNESAVDVMVGQNAGLYISGRLMQHPDLGVRVNQQLDELIPTNWLIWEADSITYTLISSNLDQVQLLSIAESLSG